MRINMLATFTRSFRTLGSTLLLLLLTISFALPGFAIPDLLGSRTEEVSFRQTVTTPSGTALGGTVDLTLRSDGTYKAHFHMHDSGAVDYKFVVRAVFTASNGTAFALQHSGEVEGTESTSLTSGPKRDSDKDVVGSHLLIKNNWNAVKAGKMSVTKDYSKAGVIGFIEDLSKVVADIAKGAARGAVSAVIGLGEEMVQAFNSLELAGTIGVIAGVAVIASGGSVVLAVVTGIQAGAVTKALIHERPVTPPEMAFANIVFRGTLPPAQNIVLTNLEGLGGRAFTIPGPNNKIYVNIGSNGMDHPLTHLRSKDDSPGRLFIHELTHVWQIHHRSFVPGFLCDGLIAQADNTFGDAYEYRSDGMIPWDKFEIEQQGAIVDEYFAGMLPRKKEGLNPDDPTDPYFRYIRDNVREGKPPLVATNNDFSRDGYGDILWYNSSSGESQIWNMNVSSRVGRATVSAGGRPALIGPPWRIVGSADFDEDGFTDILWHNDTSGETQIWNMTRAERRTTATVVDESGKPIMIGPPWSIAGTRQDGKPHIVWQNSSTGETQLWKMNGNRLTGRATVMGEDGKAILVGLPWRIAGGGDFNFDGKADLLWHNGRSNETQIWLMDEHRVTGRRTVQDERGRTLLVGTPWRIVGANDFDRDGSSDILWHNDSSGETQMWLMNGYRVTNRATVDAGRDGGGAAVGLPWSIMNH